MVREPIAKPMKLSRLEIVLQLIKIALMIAGLVLGYAFLQKL